ncbi:MAG: hypothetical protein HRU28_00380 [Rhizobiales bacterium]|nr:hypothetical protein [Hyphomicrobiales bacterium]
MDIKSFLNPKMYKKIGLLPPEALKYLLAQIEEMPNDEPDKPHMLRIAEIAKKTLMTHENNTQTKKTYNLQRYFFLPFEKIIFSGELDQKLPGRISRTSMKNIWDYVCEQLIPNDIGEYEMAFKVSIQKKEVKKAKIIVNEFNRLVGQKLEEVVKACRKDEREWRRLGMALGSKVIALDAEELSYYLQNIPEIEKAIKYFADEIIDLSGKQLVSITNDITKIKDEKPSLFPFYVTLLIGSLKYSEHSMRIIQKYYRIDDASAASKSDLSLLGEGLIFNAKIHANNFETAFKNKQEGSVLLRHYQEYAKVILGLERELEISPISSWGKDIIALRSKISININQTITNCPKLIKNVLGKYQNIVGDVIAEPPIQFEIDELINCVELFYGIKNYIAASSCNAAYSSNFSRVIQSIELLSEAIVEQLRRECLSNQKILLQYLEIATILLRIIKSSEEAQIYKKGGLLAIRDTNTA